MSASNQKGSMQKTLSLWNFFTIGFGAIIGTGWVLLLELYFYCLSELYSENLLQQSLFPAASLNM